MKNRATKCRSVGVQPIKWSFSHFFIPKNLELSQIFGIFAAHFSKITIKVIPKKPEMTKTHENIFVVFRVFVVVC